MRLFLDQMLRPALAELLAEHGHEVVRAEAVGLSRADDSEIFDEARKRDCLLVTLDAHFGDWAVLPLAEHCGVLRLKVHPPTTDALAELMVPFLQHHRQDDFLNHLVILTRRRVRWVRTGA